MDISKFGKLSIWAAVLSSATVILSPLERQLLAQGGGGRAELPPSAVAVSKDVEQRYHGDTLWMTTRRDGAKFVQRQVLSRGALADTIRVDLLRDDTLVRSRTFVYRGDTVWLWSPQQVRRLVGTEAAVQRALWTLWQAHYRLEGRRLERKKSPE